MRLRKRRSGFTLVELMIVCAIVGIVFSLAPNLMRSVTRFTKLSNARVKTQESARNALANANQLLRQASSSTIVISQESGQPPASSIRFTTTDGRTINIFQSNDKLKFSQNGSTRTFSDGLRYIAFTYPRTDNTGILSVSVTFEASTYEGGTKALQMAIEKVRVMND